MSELGVNKVVLLGRSGGDAELKFTSGGKPVANFSVAVNESFKNRDGDRVDRVEWFRCVAWNGLVKSAGQYVTRGKQVYRRRKVANAQVRRQGRQREDGHRSRRQRAAFARRSQKWIEPGRSRPGGQPQRPKMAQRTIWRTCPSRCIFSFAFAFASAARIRCFLRSNCEVGREPMIPVAKSVPGSG